MATRYAAKTAFQIIVSKNTIIREGVDKQPKKAETMPAAGDGSRAVVRFYNKRGGAEQWIRERKQAVKMARLSCHRFRSNEVRLCLSVIAYNLGSQWRRLVLPLRVGNWSLTSLQQRLLKHARY